jgi:hypothetical protein
VAVAKTTSSALAGIDIVGLTPDEIQELEQIMGTNLLQSNEGISFKPQRYKVNKDIQVFVDPMGEIIKEIEAVVLLKQKTRGHWQLNDKIPLCSSTNAIEGVDRDGVIHACAQCPNNAWGSGKEGRGKECKEMRRAYLLMEDSPVPIQISFPPTSISPYDDFFSARITAGIADIAQKVIFALDPKEAHGQTFSQVKLKNGAKLSAKEIINVNTIRNQFVAMWRDIAIDADDYGAEEVVEDGEPY